MNCEPRVRVSVGRRDRDGLRAIRVTAGGAGTLWGWVGGLNSIADWADGFGYFDLPDYMRRLPYGYVGWIDGIAVSESCRGTGLGRELMDAAHTAMVKLGVETVFLQASPQAWEPTPGVAKGSVKRGREGLDANRLLGWYESQGYLLLTRVSEEDGNVMQKFLTGEMAEGRVAG